jgi:hypothetical protein
LKKNKKEIEKFLQELQYWERSRRRNCNKIVKAMIFRFLHFKYQNVHNNL